jgi:hypothetical protein
MEFILYNINNMQKQKRCNLLKKGRLIIYLNINKVPIIYYENIFKIYLVHY